MTKPICVLSNVNGNVFAIIGHVSETLKRNDQPEKATEFRSKALSAGSYDEVLCLLGEYVEISFGDDKESLKNNFRLR